MRRPPPPPFPVPRHAHPPPGDHERSGGSEGAERASDRFFHDLFDEEAVAEADLEFGRVDVDVDRIAREVEEEEQRRAIVGRDGGPVARLGGPQEERVADRAAAHEHVAFAARGSRVGGPLSEAADLERPFAVGDGEERLREGPAPQLANPLDRAGGRAHVDDGAGVARERKGRVEAGEGEGGDRLHDGTRFCRLSAQELAAGRRIEEQATHGDARAALADDGLRGRALAADDAQAGAVHAIGRGVELEAGHGGDGREGFAAEPERTDPDQVVRLADLARRVAREGQLHVGGAHAGAVVVHPDQAFAPVLDLHADRVRPGIEGIFHELLHD
ncbi:MAG TPA: hypothetical protein VM736_13900 [Gemmatimonadales bacterium]|nr:hypothetical protein [Gemmatimonadales bacterium]